MTAGLSDALEIGVATATLGLVLAGLIGGPIAKDLIDRHKLSSEELDPVVGVAYDDELTKSIAHTDIMAFILTIHVAIILGWFANEALTSWGYKLPLFVTCLLAAILMSNTVPKVFTKISWPARSRSLALVSDFSLRLFLFMPLMSMQLWSIADMAGPLFGLLLLQTLATIVFLFAVFFKLVGGSYEAAVLSAGFGGFALGATPTAIANMTAVTKKHGPAPLGLHVQSCPPVGNTGKSRRAFLDDAGTRPPLRSPFQLQTSANRNTMGGAF